ncbi:hypothetical protein JVT61DRAFT_12429 [Boletus reticuloceps]|uniref:Uncharacterized protein n=1 Tax=Boletus reticuloceps TaxID=495285 RepID=A0A8I2YDQ0_9AGAM|nr:hypothetical protein JVT61DRAFT_12429 [Boletus reticuloceps]
MPACTQNYRCFCSLCSELDPEGVAQNPGGKLVPLKYQSIHLRNVWTFQDVRDDTRQIAGESHVLRAVSNKSHAQSSRLVGNNLGNDLTSAIGKITITSSPSPAHPRNSSDVRRTAIESLVHRAISNESLVYSRSSTSNDAIDDLSATINELTITTSPPSNHPISSSDHPAAKSSLPSEDNNPRTTSILLERELLSKQERNRRTVNAHRVLDSIESQVQFINRESMSSSSLDVRSRLSSKLRMVKERLSCLKRKVPSVVSHKSSILQSCIDIDKRLDSGEIPLPTDDPVKYDSCKYMYIYMKQDGSITCSQPTIFCVLLTFTMNSQ